MRNLFLTFLASLPLFGVDQPFAVAQSRAIEGLEASVEVQASLSDGTTPLWLNANRYGLSSLDDANGYVRGTVARPLSADKGLYWGFGYGADLAVTQGYTSRLVVQQLYAEGRYKRGTLTVGQRQQSLNLKPQGLSTGGQTLGINARPVPGVRLGVEEYWPLPYTHQWVSFRGHIFYGRTTDGDWQRDYTAGRARCTDGVWLHTKAGFLRFGREDHPFSVEAGLEMADQFGGRSFNPDGSVSFDKEVSLKSFWYAFAGGTNDAESLENNTSREGNLLGSWLLRLNYDLPNYYIGLYADHFFEDESQMFFVDYDGYGTGSDWNTKKETQFLLYPLKDIQLGLEVKLKQFAPLNDIVVEFFNSTEQSGPVYHDHSPYIPDHIGGDDDYCNHLIYLSYSHWGQVMGNPLYKAPLYNEGTTLNVLNNRLTSWHLGLSGDPLPRLHYRVLATWQRGWGSYKNPFDHPTEAVSLLGEASYDCSEWVRGLSLRLGVAMDRGDIYGDNFGTQLSVNWKIK